LVKTLVYKCLKYRMYYAIVGLTWLLPLTLFASPCRTHYTRSYDTQEVPGTGPQRPPWLLVFPTVSGAAALEPPCARDLVGRAGGKALRGVGHPKEETMATMLIMPQDWPKRLHEWVAVERGYFDEVGLDYRFRGSPPEWDELRPGGFVRQAHEEMVATEPTGFCDCSWGVLVSTGAGAGRFIPDFYTEAHLCIYARPDSGITAPDDLAGKPIAVSELTGSHFSTVEALERHIDRKDIRLHFTTARHSDAAFYSRLKELLEGVVPAANLLDIPHGPLRQIAEHHGMRLVLEGTFKRLDYFSEAIPEPAIRRFVQAIRLAQDELDCRPEDYRHYLWREVPRLEQLFQARIDPRRIIASPRIVFTPFDASEFARTLAWLDERGLSMRMVTRDYARLAARV
jgi:hypothetical protein